MTDVIDLEKDLVLRILRDALGVEVWLRREETIRANRPSDVRALISYGGALLAFDQDDWPLAIVHLDEALSHDPAYAEARGLRETLSLLEGKPLGTSVLSSRGHSRATDPPYDAQHPGHQLVRELL